MHETHEFLNKYFEFCSCLKVFNFHGEAGKVADWWLGGGRVTDQTKFKYETNPASYLIPGSQGKMLHFFLFYNESFVFRK